MPFIGNQPALAYTSFAVQHFTTSATTSYTLDYPVANENEIRLVINNVVQQPGSSYAYTASGTSLTLSAATTGTDTMYAVFLGKAVQTVNPPNGSVGLSQLSATGTKDSTTFLRGDNTFSVITTPDEYFLYKVSADQNISSATTTKVQLATAVISNTNFDSTTNYRYTVPSGKAGKYFIAISGNWLTAGDFNNCVVYAYVNGTQKLASNIVQEHYENNYHAKIISLSVGDYVEMYCRQESGSTVAFRDSGSDSPNGYMMGYRIGA